MLKQNLLLKIKSYQIFIISILICISFYYLEGIVGIDRFYHPDSIYYLSFDEKILTPFWSNILDPLNYNYIGYLYLARIFNYDYHFLVGLNFLLYSLTNVIIYEKILKYFSKKLSFLKLIFIFYLLFFDPYRLHLACHVLKETILIFLMTIAICYRPYSFKLISLLIFEFFRKYALVYFLILVNFKQIKNFFNLLKYNINKKYFFFSIFNYILIFSFFFIIIIFVNLEISISLFQSLVNRLEIWHYTEMPQRNYDHINNFQNYNLFKGVFLKLLTWPFLFISGTFLFFTSSNLFKLLGIFIFIQHVLVFFITKKTYINLGLILFVILLSLYTTSFTPMFRYGYIGIYSSLLFFFYNICRNEKN